MSEIERLLAVIAHIGRMSAPGSRTLDDFMRDMMWINDETRRALEQARKGLADTRCATVKGRSVWMVK